MHNPVSKIDAANLTTYARLINSAMEDITGRHGESNAKYVLVYRACRLLEEGKYKAEIIADLICQIMESTEGEI